jgi:hypothetical protein
MVILQDMHEPGEIHQVILIHRRKLNEREEKTVIKMTNFFNHK